MPILLRCMAVLAFALIMGCAPCEAKDMPREEADRLIEAIRNKNPPPKLRDLSPYFPKTYDWEEHERVLKAIQTLVDRAEEALPTLVAHFDDEEYATTYHHDREAQNYSVGLVCRWIVIDSLTAAYGGFYLRRVRIPPFISEGGKWVKTERVAKWFEDHRDRPFWELQVQTAEWASTKLKTIEAKGGLIVEEEKLQEQIKEIEESIEKLKRERKSVRLESFIVTDLRTSYSKERGERLREFFDEEDAKKAQKKD